MAFHLRRLRDNVEEHGGRSEAIAWKEDGTYDKVVSHIPTVGCSILVGSVTARTYANQDYWLTTKVTEIIEEKMNEEGLFEFVRFKTQNSEYIVRE